MEFILFSGGLVWLMVKKDNLLPPILLGIIVDILSGWTVGWTSFYFWLTNFLISVYEVYAKLNIKVFLVIAIFASVIYWYVSRRFFF